MSAVRHLYKELIQVSKRLPIEQQPQALKEIRETFHQNMNKTDEAEIASLMEKGKSRLGFLRMITPRVPSTKTESTTYIVNEKGELVEGHSVSEDKAKLSHWGFVGVDLQQRNEAFLKKLNMKPTHSNIM
ncbi:hypothetical protein WA158_007245 [Blastocystis sp. Blastoise]